MFVLLLLVLNVLMLFFTFSSFSDKKRIFVLLAESMSVFLCLYSLLSALMWVFEVFSVEFCLLAVTVLVTAIFAIVYFKSGKKGAEFFSFGEIIRHYEECDKQRQPHKYLVRRRGLRTDRRTHKMQHYDYSGK